MSIDSVALAFYGTAGVVAGTLYFLCVWWNARLLATRGRTWITILALPGRILVLGCVLTLAARQGATPLLAMALGVFIARFIVMRGLRAPAP